MMCALGWSSGKKCRQKGNTNAIAPSFIMDVRIGAVEVLEALEANSKKNCHKLRSREDHSISFYFLSSVKT
jgi:hypothetical protein